MTLKKIIWKDSPYGTVEAAPIVYAEWRKTNHKGIMMCSHCGFMSRLKPDIKFYNYCSNCGAKMVNNDD
jgi:hypothetical protein